MKLDLTKVTKAISKNSPDILKSFFKGCKKHSPEIFTGLSIAGVATTVVLTAKGTVKAVDILREEEATTTEPLTVKEKIVLTWKCYIPAASSAVTTGVCIAGINAAHKKRTATIAAAAEAMRHMLSDYQDAVVEVLDEEQYEKVKEKYHENQVKSHPFNASSVIYTGHGDDLFFDPYGGRFFYCSVAYIEQSLSEINALLSDYGEFVELNTLFEQLKLPHIKFGEKIGWYSSPDGDYVRAIYTTTLTDDLRSAIVVDYSSLEL